MSGLRVDLLTQSGDYPEPVRGLKVFCRRVRLLWVFLKVEKKNWVNPAFSTGGIRTHDPRIRSTVALPTKLRGLAETNRGRVCNFIVG